MSKVVTVDIRKQFARADYEAMLGYVKEQVEYLVRTWQSFWQEKLPEWRRTYKGLPRNEHLDFPWENASNLVIQVIGTSVDNIVARIVGSTFQLRPIAPVSIVGDWPKDFDAEQYRSVLEQALDEFGLDPQILDLYSRVQLWFTDAVKFGTKVVKTPWEFQTERLVLGEQLSSTHDTIVHDGPRVENIEPEDFATYPNVMELERSPFKFHILRLTRQQLESRVSSHGYDKTTVDTLLGQPDDFGASFTEIEKLNDSSLATPQQSVTARYYLYECWFPYFKGGAWYRLVVTWSRRVDKAVRAIFNPYDGNVEPFEVARLGYRTGEFLGYGIAEMLSYYQEEVSALHNKRNDNMTVANIQGVRVSTRNAKVDSNFKLAPGFIFPGESGDIEPISFGSAYRDTTPDEQLVLQEIADRVGTAPAVAGMGGGTVNKKGVYSSQGTMSVMQAGNSRSDLDIMDMRYAFVRLMRKVVRLYSQFGVNSQQLRVFGTQAETLKQAFEFIKDGRLKLTANAATASVNKELERQNTILMAAQIERQRTVMSQILQAVTNPMVPPEVKSYLIDSAQASCLIQKKLLKAFSFDDTEQFVPKPAILMATRRSNVNTGSSSEATAGPLNNGAAGDTRSAAIPGTGVGVFPQVPGAPMQ